MRTDAGSNHCLTKDRCQVYRSVNDELLPGSKITIYVPSVCGKNVQKNIELSPINRLEPASHKKGQMPILNGLRPKEIFEQDRYASGWSAIYDHSTNPVNLILVSQTSRRRRLSG